MKVTKLSPIKESPEEYEPIEDEIAKVLRDSLYRPLVELARLPQDIIANSQDSDPLYDAILSGRIVYYRTYFIGRFTAAVSRALKGIGAKWDRRQGSFKISLSDLPDNLKQAIRLSDDRFRRVLKTIDNALADMLPNEIAEKLRLEKMVDRSLFKMEKDINQSIKNITVAPKLPPERVKTLAREYNDNMKLNIKNWCEDEIKILREKVSRSTFKGNRYEELVKTISSSYGVSKSKAKFLARQETNLLLASYKKSRLMDAGLPEYEWCCVHASPDHPVRPMHWALKGKIFRWDDPPIVNEKGDRKNPGEDYGCRCYARPIVRFK